MLVVRGEEINAMEPVRFIHNCRSPESGYGFAKWPFLKQRSELQEYHVCHAITHIRRAYLYLSQLRCSNYAAFH
jgi:hypothetical protein